MIFNSFFPPSELEQPYTITEINSTIASIIEGGNNLVWAEGEISNWKAASSGHCYLRLTDEQSQIPAVIWRSNAAKLPFTPEDGMAVVVIASIKVFQRGGYYQLDIHKMVQVGQGKQSIAFEKLKQKLKKEGFFDQKHKKSLPDTVKTLGIITSKKGAALQDIVRVVSHRAPQTDIVLLNVSVQGMSAPFEITEAIKNMNEYNQVDCIIVGRGGGSAEDLSAFNDENVARAVFESKIPVISAVGHEIDFTICDFVADMRAPTPSAAAEHAVADNQENERYFRACSKRLINNFAKFYSQNTQRYNRAICSSALSKPFRILEDSRQSLDDAEGRYHKAIKSCMRDFSLRLSTAGSKLHSLSPLSVLERGYSVTRNQKGKSIRSCKELKENENVSITFMDGTAQAKIEKLSSNRNISNAQNFDNS
ncbi:exodeoxyribonuclease VII large subunit [Chitinispirillales bacterium ANBcel5]|uniref:exodeoxyribonuclease VII large subunit n=1 Tax=Cellulosispirillum alkaliphilum TaxID=3039283 RepID=UPI002A594A27|nr:exodeoxyribonuclease VII large subunit [Chitinispirillales bacterium ANBcel5]